MWLGMLGGGVCTVNTNKFRFNYDSLEALREHCPTSSVRSVYQEDNGNLWMGIMGFGLVFMIWNSIPLFLTALILY